MDLNSILIPKIKEFFPNGEQKGDEWWTCNPLRDDTQPNSFSINLSNGLWKDFADNSSGNLVKLICDVKKIKFGELAKQYGFTVIKEKQFHHFKLGYPNAIYPYHTIDGTLVGYICRFDTQNGKELRPYSNNKWSKEGFPVPHPLFNCHKLIQCKKILIVEGEKTCISAQKILGDDFVVVTWLGGASAVNKSDWSILSSKSIYLWPDNDEPGIKAMQQIYKKLTTAERDFIEQPEIKIIDISYLNLPKGWDLADADESWTRDKIIEILEQQPKITATPENFPSFIVEHDPRLWVDAWFKSRNVKINSGHELSINGKLFLLHLAVAEMNCDFTANKPEKSRITHQVLRNAFDLKIEH